MSCFLSPTLVLVPQSHCCRGFSCVHTVFMKSELRLSQSSVYTIFCESRIKTRNISYVHEISQHETQMKLFMRFTDRLPPTPDLCVHQRNLFSQSGCCICKYNCTTIHVYKCQAVQMYICGILTSSRFRGKRHLMTTGF